MAVITVDVGTSMIKAVVFDDDGNEAAVARRATEVRRPRPGRAEQDMDDVWRMVAAAIREVLERTRATIDLLAVTAQGDGCWPVDDTGRPTGPAILWSDGRAAAIVEEWRADGVLDTAFRRNGSLTFAGLPNALLTWLSRNDPDRLRRTAAVLTCGGWIFHQLTGAIAVDESDASAPFLDLGSRGYDPACLDLFGLGWAADLLPEVRGDDRRTGGLTPAAATELGLPADLPVVMAPYDIAATALGIGAVTDGQACSILGTTLCTEVVTSAPDTTGDPSGLTIALDSSGHLLRAFPTLAGTEILGWAAALLGTDGPAELGDLAMAATPEPGGPLFLPYLSPAGERAPFLDPHARGTWWGLSLEHDRARVARSVFEGLTLVLKDCLTASRMPVTELRLSGGGANSDHWCALIADVTGVPVVRSADTEVGAKGAFLSGLVATGRAPDLATAAADHVRLRSVREPDPHLATFYTHAYERFLDLRDLARPGWRRTASGPAITSTGKENRRG
ncbi:carbohydrate kinase [Nocardiopsis sp. EMB25]|uniref:FGGY-family carbohydrate kinase n=1 Tax=Nocardiopsis sp. EMB25 TaxID=2835867 RepID=UPI002284781C|nr:FGGY-family carbohydrate kinase [Nocardiopsis sp. EMB25]MCY9784599.1 carbohydrate kinase [Nocardiopsis sp. EMB25]